MGESSGLEVWNESLCRFREDRLFALEEPIVSILKTLWLENRQKENGDAGVAIVS